MFLKKAKTKFERNHNLLNFVLGVLTLAITCYATLHTHKPVPSKPSNTPSSTKTKDTSFIEFYHTNEKTILYCIAASLFLICIFLTVRLKKKRKLKLAVFSEEGRFFRGIKDLMEECLLKEEISISAIKFTDITHINDIKSICVKVFYPQRSNTHIENAIIEARRTAFSIKYSNPSPDDEKIVGKSEFGDWEQYLFNLVNNLNIQDFKELTILDVGIGNTYSYSDYFADVQHYIGVDLSSQALSYAKEKIKHLKPVVNEAEDLNEIDNGIIDLYLSLRTYQSTLFDRRKALHEARRVLKPGGIIIISLPILYYTKKEGFIKGLSDSSKNISMDYAYTVANNIKKYLEMLNFEHVDINNQSPFELFIHGQLEN